jgi:hypothetical protein
MEFTTVLANLTPVETSWRTSPEGALSPRVRRTLPEGAFSFAALAGRGGHQGRNRVVCAFWLRGLVCVLRFLRN